MEIQKERLNEMDTDREESRWREGERKLRCYLHQRRHLSQEVPWPCLQHSLETRLSVAVTYFKSIYTSKCNHNVFPPKAQRSLSSFPSSLGTSSVNEYTIHFRTLVVGMKQRYSVLTAKDSTWRFAQPWHLSEPMQVDTTRLTPTERNRRLSSGLCLYCGNNGHFIRNCPVKPPRSVEDLRFLLLEDSTVSIILKRPWLHLHTSELRWDPCDIIRWNKQCYDQCLSNIPLPQSIPVPLASTQVESPEPEIFPEIPAEYVAFQDVFSKQAATHLPPHRPWDCAIKMLPGAQLPKGQIYPLSIPGRQTIKEYIAEALQQGFIQPSTSLAASSGVIGWRGLHISSP
ncbi:Retrotransposon Gag-like protein 3 [Labeo rohita]|uniref:Retrotransposon Gag-like protein 3 n=1 Tax=Labeo rohita TaxID=84645 RepID=A0ABQ8MB59_LABRO|nr:Retrotransposon Gag-like protein 3 [Labeo rohita]